MQFGLPNTSVTIIFLTARSISLDAWYYMGAPPPYCYWCIDTYIYKRDKVDTLFADA